MSKKKNLQECKTWDDFRKYSKDNGLEHLRTTGGHEVWGNERGSVPFSAHEKEPGKGLRCKLIKEIKALLILAIFIAFLICII